MIFFSIFKSLFNCIKKSDFSEKYDILVMKRIRIKNTCSES